MQPVPQREAPLRLLSDVAIKLQRLRCDDKHEVRPCDHPAAGVSTHRRSPSYRRILVDLDAHRGAVIGGAEGDRLRQAADQREAEAVLVAQPTGILDGR